MTRQRLRVEAANTVAAMAPIGVAPKNEPLFWGFVLTHYIQADERGAEVMRWTQ
jgi:hypothetical protein